ncbi:Re/Si-specific NAD(P)(+) transhydrogenase subunit alpha [Enterobacteriaceae endosymbiont of Macroplea appendiculata]|uniref:Re/Si-specific NAD(P)(+) transhydrogenase subunit alpha n=1 Tax=Enterobacteriaceae endosymbiont of Macroplea appendiculata TaxID=2675790 RepID=UPI001448F66C|nr:Re/Si-specific NAD(P)(+) transhydrogenase subunit alpha [Enterobacteriaceae endosymbiont of Macroplea appendiculata]QJC30698.1 Re/Si-specific NAD(P)(+) transhydrogenase subunit alpha [Enterobacteriaceae endosymbiont of Macroplea appendiculata]
MFIGVPKETLLQETRIAIVPNTIKKLIQLGFSVSIEKGAGVKSYFLDKDFINCGAKIVTNNKVWECNIIIKINPPTKTEISFLQKNTILICFMWPNKNNDIVSLLASRNITTFAMDLVPRISRAQSLDALSSMSNLAGYRSIIESIYLLSKPLNGQITAAGKIYPAKVLVIGAGVAGLSAIATAKSLGAEVIAFDTRKEVKEQISSMGATFLEYSDKYKQYEKILKNNKNINANIEKKTICHVLKNIDIIITTASIPNQKAPILIDKDMVAQMNPGSIIFDLSIENGGNCELSKINKTIVTNNNVTIIGHTNLPSKLPIQSSKLYSNNITNFLNLLYNKHDKKIHINLKDEIIHCMLITYKKQILWPIKPFIQKNKINNHYIPPVKIKNKNVYIQKNFNKDVQQNNMFTFSIYTLICVLICYISFFIPPITILHLNIFILSCIIGYYVIWNVDHKLHTPLMSVTNAISGIIIIGAILQMNSNIFIINILSFVGILVSSINIFGGLAITRRMLKMFS